MCTHTGLGAAPLGGAELSAVLPAPGSSAAPRTRGGDGRGARCPVGRAPRDTALGPPFLPSQQHRRFLLHLCAGGAAPRQLLVIAQYFPFFKLCVV